jgi:ATP-dependent Clp protease ATP-binding subunit ClpX
VEKIKLRFVNLLLVPSVFICNECVDLCNDIINEETKQNDDLDHNENKDKPLLTPEGNIPKA